MAEWGVDNPEYFDHFIDQYFLWTRTRAAFPWERGILSGLALEPNSRVLDLCCGDGFNAYHFYSLRASEVVGIDFEPEAIRWARRNFEAPNLRFVQGDIRRKIPSGPFNNVVWDAAIEHFTEVEIMNILLSVKAVLVENGTLSGHTITQKGDKAKHLEQHEHEFHDKADLARFLTPHFRNVHVFETEYPQRTNLYFFATDGPLPFDRETSLIIRAIHASPASRTS